MFGPFHQIHERPHDGDDGEDRDEKHHDLRAAFDQRDEDDLGAIHVFQQLENTKDAQETKETHDDEKLRPGQEQAEISRDDGEQINDAVEAGGVAPGLLCRPEPGKIFHGEDEGEDPFQTHEKISILSAHRFHTDQQDSDDADQNGEDEQEIEGA